MNRQRLTSLIVIALLALGVATYWTTRHNTSHDSSGALLFPSLGTQLNGVSEIIVYKGADTPAVSVQKKGELWTVSQRANYPADLAKLRRLMLSLTDAKIIEEKTSNPASYSIIGVEDPKKPEASGAEVDLTAPDGKHALIVGKSAPDGTYVRRASEEKSYSVAPGISVDAEPRFWIDTKLLDLNLNDIQRLDVKIDGAPEYVLHRAAPLPAAAAAPAASAPPIPPPPSEFVLDNVPAGRKIADPATVAPSTTTYSNLTIDDVAQAQTVDMSKFSVVKATLANGNVVTLTGAVLGEKHWVTVAATQDAVLTSKTTGRIYEISNFRYDAIFRPLEKLLQPKSEPEAKKTPAVKTKT
jgi:Domain of unknown function (DUF4340)